MQKGKLMFGTALAAGLCGAAITGVETTVDPRAASYLTGTTTVTVDAPAEVARRG